jgi:hypothetical protein
LINSQPTEPISQEEQVEEIISEERSEAEQIKVVSDQIESEIEETDNVQETNTVEEKVVEQDELNKLINSAAIASSFVERELESLPKLNQEFEITEKIEEDEKSEAFEETNSIEEKSIGSSSPKSFTEWLKSSSNSNQQEIEEEAEEERKPEYYTFEKPKKEFFSPTKCQ